MSAHPQRGGNPEEWVAYRIECARRGMVLFDALPYEIRQALSKSLREPRWALIREISSAYKAGKSSRQLLNMIAKHNGLDKSTARSAPKNLTLSQLEI